jgi:two-component system, OmpR family, sensor histidine kinase MtrB
MARRRFTRLSTRVTLFFGAMALIGGIALAVATFFFARNSLLDQRVVAAQRTAIDHALDVRSALDRDPDGLVQAVQDLDTETDGFAIVLPADFLTGGRPIVSRTGFSTADVPEALLAAAANGEYVQQIYENDEGAPMLGIAVHVRAFDIGFIETFPLAATENTLRALATAFIVGAALATLFATFFGWSTSRQLLRPISRVADAAEKIASGTLGARLEEESDPDLNRLAGSFNDMADAVQERIEREERFASDVSPRAALPHHCAHGGGRGARRPRSDLPERTQQALDVVVSQVRRFDDMVIDLLELSRIEAGATDLHPEAVDIVELCDRVSQRFGYGDLPIEVHRRAKRAALVDKVRFERILGNLLDNATHHAGGPIRISIEPSSERGSVQPWPSTTGPGVAASERTRIFERFARGSAARHRIGTGLGLALVAEHATRSAARRGSRTEPGAVPGSSCDSRPRR